MPAGTDRSSKRRNAGNDSRLGSYQDLAVTIKAALEHGWAPEILGPLKTRPYPLLTNPGASLPALGGFGQVFGQRVAKDGAGLAVICLRPRHQLRFHVLGKPH